MKRVAEVIGFGLLVVALVACGLSVPVGMIYWAVNDSLLRVALSAIVPVYGIVSTTADLLL